MKYQAIKASLKEQLVDGLIVDRKWLSNMGFNRSLVDYYLRSGALVPVARGAYRRAGPPLKWEHIIYSLQELDYPVYVGGYSALKYQGFAHYIAINGSKQIDVYGVEKLPSWVSKLDSPYQFVLHKKQLFDEIDPEAITTKPFGHWDWLVRYATPELALIEMADKVKTEADFEVLDKIFESAATLRSVYIMTLLKSCKSIKAKRLFLWFSERHNFAWFKRLILDSIDLGSGKRAIVKGGVLDVKYGITVPREMVKGEVDGF